jgi:hypothetical protein
MVWLWGGAAGIVLETGVLGGRRRSRETRQEPIWSQSKARALFKGPARESKMEILSGDDHFSFCY